MLKKMGVLALAAVLVAGLFQTLGAAEPLDGPPQNQVCCETFVGTCAQRAGSCPVGTVEVTCPCPPA